MVLVDFRRKARLALVRFLKTRLTEKVTCL